MIVLSIFVENTNFNTETKVNDIVFSEGKYYGAKNTDSYSSNSTDKTTIAPNFYIIDFYKVNVVISKKDRI